MTGTTPSPKAFLLSRLASIGCPADTTEALLTSVETLPDGSVDRDGRRMLTCLAIDVAGGSLRLERLGTAVQQCLATGEFGRKALGRALPTGADKDFSLCVHSVLSPADPIDVRYASLMKIEKFLFFFRRAGTVGGSGVARVVDYLSAFAGDEGAPEDDLVHPLRGRDRPITWITNAELVLEELRTGDEPSVVAHALIEKLGLPWEDGIWHHVVVALYPQVFDASTGQPNCICEDWGCPGLFVSAATGAGWGTTCGRSDQNHKGWPERVHDEFDDVSVGDPFRILYLGRVRLGPFDRNVALAAAEERWGAMSSTRI